MMNKGCAEVVGGLVGLMIPIWLVSQCTAKHEPTADEIAATARQEVQDRTYARHCLSAWDGSNNELVDQVKRSLRDPDSFKHVETITSPVKPDGKNDIIMKFRANNGFGGVNIGYANGTLTNSTCTLKVENISS